MQVRLISSKVNLLLEDLAILELGQHERLPLPNPFFAMFQVKEHFYWELLVLQVVFSAVIVESYYLMPVGDINILIQPLPLLELSLEQLHVLEFYDGVSEEAALLRINVVLASERNLWKLP